MMTLRFWLALAAIAALQFPTSAYGDEAAKVYFEKECLAIFSSHNRTPLSENETKVEDSSGMMTFEKTIVSESRDGVAETYVQIRNCKPLVAGKAIR